jgi:hypothetical protein
MRWRATTCGRRRASGVTSVPSTTRSVAWAIAPSSTHGSCTSSPAPGMSTRWSHRNTPSHPAASASTAMATSVAASVNGGRLTAVFMNDLYGPAVTPALTHRRLRNAGWRGDRGRFRVREAMAVGPRPLSPREQPNDPYRLTAAVAAPFDCHAVAGTVPG